jgi:hypothetical protein
MLTAPKKADFARAEKIERRAAKAFCNLSVYRQK